MTVSAIVNNPAPSTYELTVARYRLGILPSEDVAAFAVEALLRDLDGPALRELAAMTAPAWAAIGTAFERAADEVGCGDIDVPAAATILARQIALEFTRGELSVQSANQRLLREIYYRLLNRNDLKNEPRVQLVMRFICDFDGFADTQGYYLSECAAPREAADCERELRKLSIELLDQLSTL